MKKILASQEPIIMGVINLTPDSFYEESRVINMENFHTKVNEMVVSGANIIDLGAMSSRPGAKVISDEEELFRLKDYFLQLRKIHPDLFISIDTVHSSVADFCLEHGADMINDISAFSIDPELPSTIAKHNAYYCLMHMQSTPETMQINPNYEDCTLEILNFLKQKLAKLKKLGVQNIVVDPGFGFGKSVKDNYQLLQQLNVFKILEHPILVGISRKSMIYKPLEINPEDSLSATSALHLQALLKGANILRVHDAKEAIHVKKLFKLLTN